MLTWWAQQNWDLTALYINSPSVCILVSLPQREESKQMTSSSFCNSRSERILSYDVGSSNMFITMVAEHCSESGRRGIARRSKGNYYHSAQWQPNSCCQEQQHVWPSFLLLPFLTLFFYCLAKLLLLPFPFWLKRWREKIFTRI